MSSGWITKDNAPAASGSSQQEQGQNDLASRLGGFGLQDKANGAAAASSIPATDKPQTVSDSWSTPAVGGASSSNAAAPLPASTAATTSQEAANGEAAPSANQDELAAAEKEAQEMSHEDGEHNHNAG